MKFLKNLLSRKFLICLGIMVLGIAMILGTDADSISNVIGALTSLVSAVAYIIAEGKIDRESAQDMVCSTEALISAIKTAAENDARVSVNINNGGDSAGTDTAAETENDGGADTSSGSSLGSDGGGEI